MNSYTSESSAATSQPNPSVSTQNPYEIFSQLDSRGQSVIVTDHVFNEQPYCQVQRSKFQILSTGSTHISIHENKLLTCSYFCYWNRHELSPRAIPNKVTIIKDTLSSYAKRLKYVE